jgi:hypothetical protein
VNFLSLLRQENVLNSEEVADEIDSVMAADRVDRGNQLSTGEKEIN